MLAFLHFLYRFHGAFTGGFSAGYFNSVGSAEGFTPATFTSSRNDRHKPAAMGVQHFMDEEVCYIYMYLIAKAMYSYFSFLIGEIFVKKVDLVITKE